MRKQIADGNSAFAVLLELAARDIDFVDEDLVESEIADERKAAIGRVVLAEYGPVAAKQAENQTLAHLSTKAFGHTFGNILFN